MLASCSRQHRDRLSMPPCEPRRRGPALLFVSSPPSGAHGMIARRRRPQLLDAERGSAVPRSRPEFHMTRQVPSRAGCVTPLHLNCAVLCHRRRRAPFRAGRITRRRAAARRTVGKQRRGRKAMQRSGGTTLFRMQIGGVGRIRLPPNTPAASSIDQFEVCPGSHSGSKQFCLSSMDKSGKAFPPGQGFAYEDFV